MTDSSRAEAPLPNGYRISPGADGASADLRRPEPSWGWGVVAAAVVWCVIWDIGLLASAGIGARMNWSGWPEDAVARWLIFFPVFWIPGIAMTALTLSQIFVREAWVLRRGHVTRRYRALGLTLERNDDVTTVQVIHGMWNGGSGAKETVWLVRPFRRGFELHKDEHQCAAVPTEILALATAVARHLAVPMHVIEMVIPEPSSD
jgi:hypothetical protein